MENNMDKSVHLFDASLSTSRLGLQINKEIPEKNINYCFDLSVTLAPHEIKRIMGNDEFFVQDETLVLQSDKFTTNTQSNNTPWKSAVDNLYREFFTILQNHLGNPAVLDTVSDLVQCCSDVLKIIGRLKSKAAKSTTEEEIWLEEECNTWQLLFILYQNRLSVQNKSQGLSQYFGASEKKCVENLFKHNSLITEIQLIIDWLECIATNRDCQIMHFSDGSVGWENTLHQLQFTEAIPYSSSRPIVTSMHPDAPYYEKKTLHDVDMEDENYLSKNIFAEIRSGNLEDVQKLCRQYGHSWKAALFEGWRLFHNPNIKQSIGSFKNLETNDGNDEMNSNKLDEIEGNNHRDVWKNAAIKYCKQECLNPYERATVASFCGLIDPILPVCNSWKDYLWAYMRSLVDICVESEIRDCCSKNEEYVPLPDEYWKQRMSLHEVFTSLESSLNPAIREESQRSEHIIQKYIILDQIPILLQKLDGWAEDPAVSCQCLRFIAHMTLFFDQIGQGHNRESVERILKSYIKKLMELNEIELIAFYVSKLNPSAQITLYSQFLEKIINNEERRKTLIYAERSGLDVVTITKQVVRNIRNLHNETEGTSLLQQEITDLDNYKISSLDWLCFFDHQKADTVIESNALISEFLTLGKIDAAQLTLNKVSTDTIEKLLSEGNVSMELNQAIKEHYSYKAYLNAHVAFNNWFKKCKCRPMPPDELPENSQFSEKVAYQHRISQYSAELERWKLTTSHLAKNAIALLYNVLLFPEGWLVGTSNEDYLRSHCIPEIILLLHKVLSDSQHYRESVQLADIIAAEKYLIYKVYPKEKLEEILIQFCESSVASLIAKKDPWGIEISA